MTTIEAADRSSLFDLDKVFRAAVISGRVPATTGQMVEELAQKLDQGAGRYREVLGLGSRGAERAAPHLPGHTGRA